MSDDTISETPVWASMPPAEQAGLSEIQRQMEMDAVEQGVQRYRKALETHHSMRGPEQRLAVEIIEAILPAVKQMQQKALDKLAKGGRPSGVEPAWLALSAEKLCLITMQTIFLCYAQSDGQVKKVTLCWSIAEAVRNEITFEAIKHGNKDLYKRHIEHSKSWSAKKIAAVAEKAGIERMSWSNEEKVRVGWGLVTLVEETTDLLFRAAPGQGWSQEYILALSEHTKERIRGLHERLEILHPIVLPMVIPPRSWSDSLDQGGYLYSSTKAVIPSFLGDHRVTYSVPLVAEAANYLQCTPFQINRDVLDVASRLWSQGGDMAGLVRATLGEIPPKPAGKWESPEVRAWRQAAREVHRQHGKDASARVSTAFKVSIANRLKGHRAIWFVNHLDFRGRIYTKGTHLQPQGDDLCRGLLRFAEAKAPGGAGMRWLKIHLANCHGVDKVSFADRIAWADAYLKPYRNGAECDPYSDRRWMDADEPWGALAALLACLSPDDAGSRVIVGVDGTCNGIQHLSALGLDDVGAGSVSMLPADKPSDIYGDVAKEVNRLIELDCSTITYDPDDVHPCWQWRGKVTRKTVKPGVMTTPYGVTMIGMREQIKAWMEKQADEGNPVGGRPYQMAEYLQLKMDEAMLRIISAAKRIMQWLRDVSDICHAAGCDVHWTTLLGFPVRQSYCRTQARRIRISNNLVTLRVPDAERRLHAQSQRRGLPPNYVHSLDACHLMQAAIRCREEGITLGATHDSYKTHACDVDRLGVLLREEFVELYGDNPLERFRREVMERTGLTLPEIPERGTLDIRQVMDAPYFFA